MVDYLKEHPLEFRTPTLCVSMWVCRACQATRGEADHIMVHAVGEKGEAREDFNTVPDAVHYLLHLAANLASSGAEHAWELAHMLTTWVMIATDGKARPLQMPGKGLN